MATSYNPKVVTSGLALYLDAANRESYPGSGSVWSDLSGNGNNCTFSGGYSFSSSGNGSVLFDGINGYGNVPDSPSISLTTATASIWFKYSTAAGGGAVIMGKHDPAGSLNGFLIALSGGTIGVQVKGASTAYNTSFVAINTNTWYNATTTFSSNSVVTFYLNGVLYSSVAIGALTSTTQPLRFADSVDTVWSIVGGSIGAASMYNRVLTASEIQQNFNALRGRYGI